MGKVLSSFGNGFTGSVSKSIDNVILPLANTGENEIGFGMPVAFDEDKIGAVLFDGAEMTAADFIGVTVRNPAKTPSEYGKSEGGYAPGDIMDVLVRGHIVVKVVSANPGPAPGDPVAVLKSGGRFTAGSETTKLPLTNARYSSSADASGLAEIVLDKRNII